MNILIVDDDRDYCTILSTFLKSEGFDIALAGSVAEAREAIRYAPPEMLLLDIVLPDGNGIPLCRQIRSITDVPIILMSAMLSTSLLVWKEALTTIW